MSQKASSFIVDLVSKKDDSVLGLATGSTPIGMYQCMIKAHKEGIVSFKHVKTFNLDEYVGFERNNPNSYFYYMNENLFQHIDISLEETNIPDGSALDLERECHNYDQKIEEAGRIDVQVLGLGLNGHIGFNEPGTSFAIRTHVIDLMESTRKANARFFENIDQVPSQALTMGIATIMESKLILLLVSGEKKAPALSRLFNGEVSEDFPASILQRHPNVIIIADETACKDLNV